MNFENPMVDEGERGLSSIPKSGKAFYFVMGEQLGQAVQWAIAKKKKPALLQSSAQSQKLVDD